MINWQPQLLWGGRYGHGAGDPVARDGSAETVRELAEKNEHLRQLVKLQGELVASVAHDLRTPLSSVLGFTQLLLRRKASSAEMERYLRIIEAEMRRFAGLIDDLYDAQLIAKGRSVLCLELFDLRGLLREQVDLFRGHSETHTLRVELPEEPVLVHADAERIARVIANLLSNAIKYSPGGGTITVETERRDGNVRVSVTDTGVGIPFEQQHLVFARFFRADTSSPGTKGVGLGLALCREIVDAHDGALGFDSIEGDGSTFWFELRADAGPAPATPFPLPPPDTAASPSEPLQEQRSSPSPVTSREPPSASSLPAVTGEAADEPLVCSCGRSIRREPSALAQPRAIELLGAASP